MKGRYFKFESFATHDGDGIRGAVFLSGCPLRCVYCHNPDSWNEGEEIDAVELAHKVAKYKDYYVRGGGATISGGEPLLQGQFTLALVHALHAEGLHVALDTAGCIVDSFTSEIIAAVDHIIIDLKFATEEDYRTHTGGSLATVLRFLDLCEGKRIWVRIVVLTHQNDTLEKLRPYAEILKNYTVEKIELLPFHTMGFSKYEELKIENSMRNTTAMDASVVERLQQKFDAMVRNARPTNIGQNN